MAENKTTTPALITHVITDGLTVATESEKGPCLDFFDADGWYDRSLEELAGRLGLPGDEEDLPLGWREERSETETPVGGRGVPGDLSISLHSFPIATDSGTKRKLVGSATDGAVMVGEPSFLGSPRAAAAQERRVERLARRAAS